jgi:hypothetical protein
MRRVMLSESVKKRERLHAFVRHWTVTFKRILRRGALPRRSPSEKISSQNFRSTACRREASCHTRIGPRARLRHSNRSGNETGVYRR